MEILRRGIPIQCAPAPVSTNGAIADNTLAVARAASISELSDWIGDYGFNARDVKLVVGHDGSVRCIAQQFIKPDVCIMVLPTALSITANSLKEELFSSNPQAWNALVERIRVFEQEFEWTENNYMRKDWFSDTLVFALRIFCGLWKIREAEAGDSELSLTLKTLQRYWKSVPSKSNDILFGWSEEELRYLRETSIYQGLDDSRRLGQEVFHHVITPFVSSFPDWFGPRIEFAEFVHICSVISTRSFGSNDDEDCTKLHPIIDLVRGKPDQSHNCVLEGLSVRGTRLRSLKVISPINAGDEVLLEYSQTGNGDYLYAYNYLPLDRNIILNNPKTIITFDMSQYFDKMLMEIHPHAPDIREAKRAHIHGGTGMPNVLFISQEELKTHKLQYLRQVLIFLQSDEATMRKTIETQRLKSRVNSQVLFSSFVRLIEFQMGIPSAGF